MSDAATPQLSVVLAATHDSPTLRAVVERHQSGLAEVGGELLIADGTHSGLPQEVPTTVHIPGADVFTLRAAATTNAKGRLVALTEDHCIPADDWHSAILRAHEDHPHVAAVGGAVLNGSRKHAIDRANFFMVFGSFLPPLDLRHPARPSPPANLSIKRFTLDEFDLVPGMLEMAVTPNMYRVHQMVQDDRVRITHVQSRSIRGTTAVHFHNGRSTAGLPFRRPPFGELIKRTAHNLALPFLLVASVLKSARWKRGYRRETLLVLPFIILLAVAHAAGEFTGTLFGPGKSPVHLE